MATPAKRRRDSLEILFEYEEVLKAKYSESVATNFLTALKELPNETNCLSESKCIANR
jgi:hypothetical protein